MICKCVWDHDNETATTNTTTAAAPLRQQKEVDFDILRKPDPRKTGGDVRSIYTSIRKRVALVWRCLVMLMVNVLIASLNIDASKSVKLIYTTGKPRFVQCIRLICKDC